jgi:hypothetical protein
MLGAAPALPCLALNWVLGLFGRDTGAAVRGYVRFVSSGTDELAGKEGAVNPVVVGSESFVTELVEQANCLTPEVPRLQRATRSLSQYAQESRDRNGAIRLAYESGCYSLSAIARHFGLHYTTVSRIVREGVRS